MWTHGAGSTMFIISPETEAHWTQMGAQFVSEHPNPILTTPVSRSQNMNVNQSSTSAAAHPWIQQTCSGNTWRITAFVLEMSRRLFLPLFPKLHCVTTLLYALLVKTLTRVYRRMCPVPCKRTALYVRLLIICRPWYLVPQGGLD